MSGPIHEFDADAKRAVYDAIRLRRDIRNFRPDAIPDDVLRRILGAAHQAGSVGFMQPWDFIVMRSPERKAAVYELFRAANERAAKRHDGDRRRQYLALKLQGILDAPLGVCVTCDRRRGGPHVLGRDTIPDMDRYSTCLAIENLWLAARAEGVGVGWVSIVDNAELARVLELPPGVEPIAYLCLGYPVVFPDEPVLETTGWRARLPLDAVVHADRWGTAPSAKAAAEPDEPPQAPLAVRPAPNDAWLADIVASIQPPDPLGERAARLAARLDQLVKPRRSLGRMEPALARLGAAQRRDYPRADRVGALIFAADHGVTAQHVSAYRPDVTARLCYNFMAGGGVANALARLENVELQVVDVGVAHEFGGAPGIRHRKVASGSGDPTERPALPRAAVLEALAAGADSVAELGAIDLLIVGEVGIGNTTVAAALLCALLERSPDELVGRGTGVGAETLDRKRDVIRQALARHRPDAADPIACLAAVGGAELAALAGAVLAAASRGIPILLDGMATGVAALAATRLAAMRLAERDGTRGPVPDYLLASHSSSERAHRVVLERLGLDPLLDLGLGVGEGSGALLALPLLRGACAIFTDVRTFREAGIDEPVDPEGLR